VSAQYGPVLGRSSGYTRPLTSARRAGTIARPPDYVRGAQKPAPVAHVPTASREEAIVAAPRRRGGAYRLLRAFEKLAMVGVALAAISLLAVIVGPRFFPYQALVVRSGSMEPTLPIGSVVFYRQIEAADVHVGQIIVFAEPGDPSIRITHRVYKIVHAADGTYFETKGDANALPDSWKLQAVGPGWVAVFHVPYIGYPFAYLSTSWARLALLSVPAIVLGLLLLVDQARFGRRPRDALAHS
jgi:signal peptidase I